MIGVFFKMLSFEREEGCKIARFTDKFGEGAIVVTTWDKIIPGLRYSCKLDCKYSELGGYREYTMLSFKVWNDDLEVITGGGIIQVTLDREVVPELDFDCIGSSDVDEKVKSLEEYFKEKTFQFSNIKERENFIKFYRLSCEHLYKKYKRGMMKGSKHKVCKENLV